MVLKPLFNFQVEYQCKGFLEKNRDTLYEELVDIMRASKVQNTKVVKHLTTQISKIIDCPFFLLLNCLTFMQLKIFETFCCQFPLLAGFFNEENQNSVYTVKGVKVKAARPGVKPTNKQLRTTVGDKVHNQRSQHCCLYL